ncbi:MULTISPECIES: hypothetical protein [unclassified Crossiella]|uniref:hypothetical protein n=1 Tax=unclassified Crossiella TaxID=2620835 RepID=UPI001FFE6398|nr:MULTISPECIES: hypothetical protein [unclassified Crossiella]MCK2237862.1 hypothetical protein [Crossiella sp. S99.2]MCK2255148.1 hypothetical protein [Crossiella sp. S99.1]
MRQVVVGALAVLGVLTAVPAAQAAPGDPWQRVGADILSGVSGAVVVDREDGRIDSLIVRDNKKPGQNRIARVRQSAGKTPKVEPLEWRGELPVDLESIEPVPGRRGEFLVLGSAGKGFQIRVSGGEAVVLRTFQVPTGLAGDDYESFQLASVGGRTVALWADRGQDSRPGTLYAAEFDLDKLTFGPKRSAEIRVPYPKAKVRHVSDLVVLANGELLISSASDPGDDGPFDSALYSAGRVSVGDNGVRLEVAKQPRGLGAYAGHKIEAVTCVSSSCAELLLGTDDENAGGYLRVVRR